jgi:hypothetical protein
MMDRTISIILDIYSSMHKVLLHIHSPSHLETHIQQTTRNRNINYKVRTSSKKKHRLAYSDHEYILTLFSDTTQQYYSTQHLTKRIPK